MPSPGGITKKASFKAFQDEEEQPPDPTPSTTTTLADRLKRNISLVSPANPLSGKQSASFDETNQQQQKDEEEEGTGSSKSSSGGGGCVDGNNNQSAQEDLLSTSQRKQSIVAQFWYHFNEEEEQEAAAAALDGQQLQFEAEGAILWFNTRGNKYATKEQQILAKRQRRWYYIRALVLGILLFLFWFNFSAVPLRIAIGSQSMPPQFYMIELLFDALYLVIVGVHFFMPVEDKGAVVTDRSRIRNLYLDRSSSSSSSSSPSQATSTTTTGSSSSSGGYFRSHLLAGFPLQVVLLPLVFNGALPLWVEDWVRINRLINFYHFSPTFDFFAESYLTGTHPTVMRIVKFVFIVYFYTIITACPVGLVWRFETVETAEWLGLDVESTFTSFMEICLMTLGLASGRSYRRPITDLQTGVMLFLGFLSLASSSIIIAGVTSMMVSLIQRSSKLSNKISDVSGELDYRGLMGSEIAGEIVSYYEHMYAAFNNFDYSTSEDFFDELPPDLQVALFEEIGISTIKRLPLFSRMVDDTEFVREMAARLELFVLLPGTEIVREGEEGDDMFFISKGEAMVIKGQGTESQRTIAHVHEGSFFGEQALLFGGNRTATIVAETLCQVYALSRDSFDAMIDFRPDALAKILEVTLARRDENEKREEEETANGSGGFAFHIQVSSESKNHRVNNNKETTSSVRSDGDGTVTPPLCLDVIDAGSPGDGFLYAGPLSSKGGASSGGATATFLGAAASPKGAASPRAAANRFRLAASSANSKVAAASSAGDYNSGGEESDSSLENNGRDSSPPTGLLKRQSIVRLASPTGGQGGMPAGPLRKRHSLLAGGGAVGAWESSGPQAFASMRARRQSLAGGILSGGEAGSDQQQQQINTTTSRHLNLGPSSSSLASAHASPTSSCNASPVGSRSNSPSAAGHKSLKDGVVGTSKSKEVRKAEEMFHARLAERRSTLSSASSQSSAFSAVRRARVVASTNTSSRRGSLVSQVSVVQASGLESQTVRSSNSNNNNHHYRIGAGFCQACDANPSKRIFKLIPCGHIEACRDCLSRAIMSPCPTCATVPTGVEVVPSAEISSAAHSAHYQQQQNESSDKHRQEESSPASFSLNVDVVEL